MNFTTSAKLELIKYNLIDIFAEALRYSKKMDKKYPEHNNKVNALVKFTQDIKSIKDLDILTKIRKRYER